MVTAPEIKKVGDLNFVLFLGHDQILEKIQEIANQINTDFENDTPLFVPILNGAFMFAADLLKEVSISCEVSFVKVASYHGTESTGEIEEVLGLQADIRGRHIILVEDIVDTGLTMSQLMRTFEVYQPASISVATLFVKPDSLQVKLPLRYVGFEIPNKFIVGYGLDYNGLGRNCRDVFQKAD
jgi:hypoxanthine phosphoribosyltransferase